LGQKFGAVDDHGGRAGMLGDQGARHDGFAGARRRDQHPGGVGCHRGDGVALSGGQLATELDGERRMVGQVHGDLQGAAGGADQVGGFVAQPARQLEPRWVRGVEAADHARGVPRGESLVLFAVEFRIMKRRGVLERGQ
jgi:hypothetical protein